MQVKLVTVTDNEELFQQLVNEEIQKIQEFHEDAENYGNVIDIKFSTTNWGTDREGWHYVYNALIMWNK